MVALPFIRAPGFGRLILQESKAEQLFKVGYAFLDCRPVVLVSGHHLPQKGVQILVLLLPQQLPHEQPHFLHVVLNGEGRLDARIGEVGQHHCHRPVELGHAHRPQAPGLLVRVQEVYQVQQLQHHGSYLHAVQDHVAASHSFQAASVVVEHQPIGQYLLAGAILDGHTVVADDVGAVVELQLIHVHDEAVHVEPGGGVLVHHKGAALDAAPVGRVVLGRVQLAQRLDLLVQAELMGQQPRLDLLLTVAGVRVLLDEGPILLLLVVSVGDHQEVLAVLGLQLRELNLDQLYGVLLAVELGILGLLPDLRGSDDLHADPRLSDDALCPHKSVAVLVQVHVCEVDGPDAVLVLLFFDAKLDLPAAVVVPQFVLQGRVEQQVHEVQWLQTDVIQPNGLVHDVLQQPPLHLIEPTLGLHDQEGEVGVLLALFLPILQGVGVPLLVHVFAGLPEFLVVDDVDVGTLVFALPNPPGHFFQALVNQVLVDFLFVAVSQQLYFLIGQKVEDVIVSPVPLVLGVGFQDHTFLRIRDEYRVPEILVLHTFKQGHIADCRLKRVYSNSLFDPVFLLRSQHLTLSIIFRWPKRQLN